MALGSAGGLPTVPSAFAWYGGSDEPTTRAMMGRMRLTSFIREKGVEAYVTEEKGTTSRSPTTARRRRASPTGRRPYRGGASSPSRSTSPSSGGRGRSTPSAPPRG